MSQTPSLLDSIRRTIEERHLFSARSRGQFVSALRTANYPNGKDSKNFKSPITGKLFDNRLIRMRKKVIQEIIKSEDIYVKQLRTIKSEFMEDAEIRVNLSRKDFNVIFGNILTLLEVNERLLETLRTPEESTRNEEQCGSGSVENNNVIGSLHSVAEAFHNYAPFLKLYSLYAKGYQQADSLLQKLISQCPDLHSRVKAKEAKLNSTLPSLLITPIQRIPRYKLLLQQLIGFIGASGKNDPDVQSLLQSIKNVDQVAQLMNEMIKQHENSCKLLEINAWMGKYYHGVLVEAGRTFVKAGTVLKPPTVILQHSLTQNSQFYLVLLSDLLISCKIRAEIGSKGCLQPILVLPLKKCEARIVDDLYGEVECENEFIRFTLTDPDDLIEWVKTINESAKSLKRRCATLKKPSSNAQPIRKEEIKNILKANKRKAVKRRGSATPSSCVFDDDVVEESPGPKPGKLRRFLNISDRLDELINYLSPTPVRFNTAMRRRSVASEQWSTLANADYDSSPHFTDDRERMGGRAPGTESRFSFGGACSIM